MAKASKLLASVSPIAVNGTETAQVEATETNVVTVEEPVVIETVTLTLPKGSKLTASKRTIIAPATEETAGKERWFETKRLTSYKVREDKLIEITIPKSALVYRNMVQED